MQEASKYSWLWELIKYHNISKRDLLWLFWFLVKDTVNELIDWNLVDNKALKDWNLVRLLEIKSIWDLVRIIGGI